MTLRRVWPLAAFVALAALLATGLRLNPGEVPSPIIGRPAPAFELPRLDDPSRTLGPAQLQGRVWLLNVWASWCAPCRQEHPLLVALARDEGLLLVGLNYEDDPRAAEEWLRRLGDPYVASLMDRDGRVGIDYGVHGVPETFVIDRAGVVRHKHVGPVSAEVWERQLRPLIRALQG